MQSEDTTNDQFDGVCTNPSEIYVGLEKRDRNVRENGKSVQVCVPI